jgi:hypothetical protein
MDQGIDAAGDTNRQTTHARGQRALVRRFDEKMHVIELYGEMHDSKVPWRNEIRVSDGAAQRRKDEGVAQRPETRAHRDVHRVRRPMFGPGAMRNARPHARRPPSAPATSFPGGEDE